MRVWPTTKLGRVAGWSTVAFVVLWFTNSAIAGIVGTGSVALEGAARLAVIGFGLSLLALGLVAGVLSGVAFFGRRDRSWTTFLGLLPAAFVLAFLAGELLFPH